MTGSPEDYYYIGDHLGSIQEVTDDTGVVLARYDYDLWGKRTKVSGVYDVHFGFTGHFTQAIGATELILAPCRAYDSETGRWLSRDWLGETAGSNRYAYCGNDPINFNDPTGIWGEGAVVVTTSPPAAVVNSGTALSGGGTLVGKGGGLGAAILLGAGIGIGLGIAFDEVTRPFGVEPTAMAEALFPALGAPAIAVPRSQEEGAPEAPAEPAPEPPAEPAPEDCPAEEGEPPLQKIHPDSTLEGPDSNIDYLRSLPTADIVESLKPGKPDSLLVRDDGRIMDGNTRIKVLEERGYNVNSLPRDRYEDLLEN